MKKKLCLFGLLISATLFAKYHSQFAQDRWLNENIFLNMKGGTFAEIGAADGIDISNTLFFESELKWKGLCVEALPEMYEKLKENRSCYCENACIGVEEKEVPFLKIIFNKNTAERGRDSRLLSGRLDTWESARTHFVTQTKNETITLTTTPLRAILEKHNIHHIDYLSVDVEGAELEVLKSIDWDHTTIGVIEIENHQPTRTPTRQFLKKKGYIMVKRIDPDDIWVKPEYIFCHTPNSSVASLLKKQRPAT